MIFPLVKVSPHFLSRFLINTTSIFANFKRCLSATKVFWISAPVYFNFSQSAKMAPKITTDWEIKSWTTKHITTFICPMSFPSFQFSKKLSKKLTRRKILYLKHSCYSYSFSSEKFWGQVSLKALFRSYSSEHRIKCSNNEAIPRFLQSQMQFFPNFCSFFCPSLYCQNKFSGGPILMTFPSLNLFNPTVP